MPLEDFYKKIVALQEFDIVFETASIINEHSDYLASLLRSQLSKGIDGKGDNVSIYGKDYYSQFTIHKKKEFGEGLGKVTKWITNYMDGTFYKSIYFKAVGDQFDAHSDVPYYYEILARSGRIAMTLTDENAKKFAEEILFPELQRRFTIKFNS